jgi:uncharacterized membrane protein YkgB
MAIGQTGRWDIEERLERQLPLAWQGRAHAVDEAVAGWMERYGVTVLRIALGVVFVWFGALKVIGHSPVEDLVRETAYFLPAGFVVPAIGVWEVIIGFGLIFPVALRLTLLMFWAQMAGTLLVLIVHPSLSFQDGNPLLLTVEGEFVIKNLVLIAAGLVIGGQVRSGRIVAKP